AGPSSTSAPAAKVSWSGGRRRVPTRRTSTSASSASNRRTSSPSAGTTPDCEEPAPSNAPLVEFSLERNSALTRLRLVESGLDQLERSQDEKDEYAGDHSRGWDVIVERLREH